MKSRWSGAPSAIGPPRMRVGVGMDDIDLFSMGKNGTNQSLSTPGVFEIGDHGKGIAAELAAELVEPQRVAIDQRNPRSFRQQHARHSSPMPDAAPVTAATLPRKS